MISIVWGNVDRAFSQPWGPTTLTLEPLFGTIHWHCGVDVPMPIGTPLYAARAGIVTYVDYGLLAISGATQTDWYVHIDRAYVYLGAPINRGNLVAYSGAKVPKGGALDGPHLHFEIQDSPHALAGAATAGYLNFPATSVDPTSVLSGTFGLAMTALEATTDMTPDQEKKLDLAISYGKSIYDFLYGGVDIEGGANRPSYEKSILLAAIQKIAPGAALSAEQAQQLAAAHDAAVATQAQVAKHLAP